MIASAINKYKYIRGVRFQFEPCHAFFISFSKEFAAYNVPYYTEGFILPIEDTPRLHVYLLIGVDTDSEFDCRAVKNTSGNNSEDASSVNLFMEKSLHEIRSALTAFGSTSTRTNVQYIYCITYVHRYRNPPAEKRKKRLKVSLKTLN